MRNQRGFPSIAGEDQLYGSGFQECKLETDDSGSRQTNPLLEFSWVWLVDKIIQV